MFASLACHVKYALIVMAIFIVIMMMSKWTGAKAPKGFVSPPAVTDIQSVVEGAARSNTNAHKTQDHVRALVDVTTALSAIQTTTSLVGSGPVTNAAGVETQVLENEMEKHQQRLIRKLMGDETSQIGNIYSLRD